MSNQSNRSQWDAGRFVNTLAYFEVIPFVSWLQRLLQGHTTDNKDRPAGGKMGVVLVAGATGGVGSELCSALLSVVIRCKH
jgi:FlaA1/EpsC-like NDP-sugar epimerase